MIELKAGDAFASRNPQGLGAIILYAEKCKSLDGKAEYGHTGIILDEKGTTFEALGKIRSQNLFEAYKGSNVLIARWNGMNAEAFQKGFDAVKGQTGKAYPFWRLFLHLFGLGKINIFHQQVCSEITDHFFDGAGAIMLSGDNFSGVTPDNLVDEWRISKYFNIVYEGEI